MAKKVTKIVSAPADPFAAIAKSAPVTATKKATKPTAEVSDEIKNSVDLFLDHKSEIKRLEAEMAQHETAIIEAVRPQQDDLARGGKFTKSMEVPGNTGALTYVTSDRFSAVKDPDALEDLKKLLGVITFDDWFETKRTITLKKEAQEDQDFIKRLVKAVADAGMNMGDAFDVVDVTVAKADLDQKQYGLKKEDLEVFRTLCRQNKPALK
jgi:phage host-nuclease inhibitor protein Gam